MIIRQIGFGVTRLFLDQTVDAEMAFSSVGQAME
jgi:hypothetical protein